MNKACVNYGIEIPNDSKDKRIKRVIEDVTFKDSIKMSIVSTFFNEDKNKSFREFLFNNLEESEKTKHSIESINNLNNETISKINMNILKSLVKKYYNVEIKDIDNYNSKESNNVLDGFQSHQARHKAKVYTATKVIEVYYGNAGNTTKLYEQVVNEVKKEFINDLCEPLIINLAAADKNSGIKEKYIIQAKEIKDIYDKIDSLQKELSEIKNFVKKNNTSSNNEIRKQVKESFEKAKNMDQNIKQLAKNRFIKLSNLIEELPVSYSKHKNYLALYNQIANNKSQWFTEVFRLKRLLPLKNIDNLLTEEEKLYQQTIEDETSFNNYENDESIDESAKTWTNTLLANYEQNIANDVKLFLSSLYELDAPIDGNEEISYSYDPDLGVRINMSAEHVIQQIYDHVNFHSIDEMINELETASKNIKSLYGLGTLVNKLRENTLLANRLYHELAQNRTSKIQVNIITNGIYARNSNEASKGKSKFIFDSVQSTLATFKSTYTAELYNKTIKNAGLTETEFNNKKKREKAINDFIEVFTSFVTNVKRSDIENYFYRSNLTYKEFNDMFNYLKEYLNKISALKSAYENVHDKYNEDYRKYKEAIRSIDMFRGLIPDNELEIPEKPKADYSSINYDNLYSSTIIEISNELFKTMAVDVQLNSLNAENNSSTDLLDNNKLQNLIKQVSYTEIDADGNITNKGLELLRDFVDSCDNYKYSNIFYGSGKTKGLFSKNPFGGPSIINKEAKDIIRLSLFDGISDRQNNKGIMYNKMTKGDYFVTQLQLFLSPINFYDNSHYDKAGYFMRTPSDAPKNFVIQTTRYKITDLFKNGVIDTKSDFFIAFRNIIYGELVDMMNAIITLSVYDNNG